MTTPNLFEHIPLEDIHQLPEPTSGPYYVNTKNGYMIHKDSHWGRFLLPVPESLSLPETAPIFWAEPKVKLPQQLIGQALSFFKAIYEKQKTEAMVDITWSPERGYRFFVPPQDVSGGGVEARRNLEHYHGQIVGTVHSHCNFNAYHSGTDEHDAEQHDGLHITIGDVLKEHPTIDLMVSASGIKWPVSLLTVVDGPLQLHQHPAWWERYVEDPAVTRARKDEERKAQNTTSSVAAWRSSTTKPGSVTSISQAKSTTVTTDLRQLLLRHADDFDTADAWDIHFIADRLEQVKDHLAEYGIEMDTEFIALPPERPINENDRPWWDEGDDTSTGDSSNTPRPYHVPF